MALDKPLEEIIEADLQALIEAATPERKTLEYKQTFPATADDDRREFLADVSSFANSTGGHLIYGMRADGGLPAELCGVEGEGGGASFGVSESARSLSSVFVHPSAPPLDLYIQTYQALSDLRF